MLYHIMNHSLSPWGLISHQFIIIILLGGLPLHKYGVRIASVSDRQQYEYQIKYTG